MAERRVARKKRTTLKDIAEMAGVSINTASAVLNPRSIPIRVTPETREKVEEAARKLDYRRNVAASLLAGGANRVLGILSDRMTNLVVSPVIGSFMQEAVTHGYQCFIGCTQNEGARKFEHLQRFLEHGIDGILMTDIWRDPEIDSQMEALLKTETPVVFFDYRWRDYPAPLVSGDHYGGGRLLTRHLVEVGHRRLAYLARSHQLDHPPIKGRIQGARDVLREAALPDVELLVSSSSDPDALAACVAQALTTDHRPTAVMVSNDHYAYALIAGLNRAGYEVPRDVAVTGFDDLTRAIQLGLEFPEGVGVPGALGLTTVRQPFDAMGKKGADLLVEAINEKAPQSMTTHMFDVDLIVRSTCQLPKGTS
jgi:LacI family transcriptional regulator